MTTEGVLLPRDGAAPPHAVSGHPNGGGNPQPGEPEAVDLARDRAAVLSLLEPGQMVEARKAHIGLRPVSPGLRVLLWGLRFYVVFMLVVVAIQVVRSLTGGR